MSWLGVAPWPQNHRWPPCQEPWWVPALAALPTTLWAQRRPGIRPGAVGTRIPGVGSSLGFSPDMLVPGPLGPLRTHRRWSQTCRLGGAVGRATDRSASRKVAQEPGGVLSPLGTSQVRSGWAHGPLTNQGPSDLPVPPEARVPEGSPLVRSGPTPTFRACPEAHTFLSRTVRAHPPAKPSHGPPP